MPSETLHFDKAPIVEAVIGLDLEEMLAEPMLAELHQLGEQLQHSYPIREAIRMGQLEWNLGAEAKHVDLQVGYFFKSKDGRQIVHAKRNGFAFSRLAPYENWENFISEAKRTWASYRVVIGPSKMTKWSVRYINKLSWPENERMEDYLQIYPHIPDSLPQQIAGCFVRLQFPLQQPQGLLTQQLVGLPQESPGKVTFMLDNEFSFSAIGLSDAAMWEQINSARGTKNKFFVDSITPKMKELIS